MNALEPAAPILTAHLFRETSAQLGELLTGLTPEQWRLPTASAAWTVKDVAAHLLDGDLRRLSCQRDGFRPPPPEAPIAGFDDLTRFLDRLNAEWVRATQRLSPRVLTELLAAAGDQVAVLFESSDPFAPAAFPVSWAGDEVSPSWLDIAREHTEKWIHQQQIRDATGRPGLLERRFLHPVLDAFLRAWPHASRTIPAADGTAVLCSIAGEAGGDWTLCREAGRWRLYTGAAADAAAVVRLDQDTAWRYFSTRRRKAGLFDRIEVEGDPGLAAGLLAMTSVMA